MSQGFTKIPNAVIRSGKKLTDKEFRLYCTLLSFKFNNGNVFPGRARIAKEMGSSRSRVDDVKRNLEIKGAFKKLRRGQGKTNLYYMNENFLSEPDDLKTSRQEDSQTGGKEEEVNKTYNYLPTSSSFKETNFGGEPQPLPDSQPKTKPEPPKDVIFRKHLKGLKEKFDSWLDSLTDNQLNGEYELSRNTEACIQGILYYIRKYKAFLGVDHPLYKTQQLKNCMYGFLNGIWDIEQTSLPVDETIIRVIDRWFATTKKEENNLLLSHFVGSRKGDVNIIFYNCLQDVMLDVGYYREEANAYS